MKAVIMAGGEGTRLRPLTSNVPKPMLPVANVPMMEHIVNLLRRHDITEIVVTVAYLANTIRTYFGDGSEFGVRMVYATEDSPLGTAGSVRNAMDELDERFLVISGDVITDIDLTSIIDLHTEKQALATIGLVAVENPVEFGIVITRDDGSIERFLEKPTWGQVFSDTINTGIFVLEPEIFDHIPADGPSDFSSDVFPALLREGKALYGAVATGYWEDVGTLEAYGRVHADVLDAKVHVEIEGFELRHGLWLGEGAEVHPDAVVEGCAIIGDSCRIDAGVRIGEYTVLGSNVRVRADADLERTVVHDNVYVGEGVRLRGAIVGRGSDLRRGSRLDDGVVVGDQCFVGENAVVTSGVKIFPFKTVEAGATINTSIVWESKGARSLFGQHGVSGIANVDITPEMAARVAMSFATTLKKGATVVTSRDSSRAGRMLKRAVMAGLNASGVNVVDLEVASVPVTRFLIRNPRTSGGITVRLEGDDAQSVIIRFFDAEGIDLSVASQRKIERLVNREDFRRVLAAEIGDIDYPPRALEHYSIALQDTIDLDAFRNAAPKLVVDYAYGSTSFVMPSLWSKFGADVLGVNPFVSTYGMVNFVLAEHVQRVVELVKASRADLGAIIDPDGEHLTLIDGDGHVLSDAEALFAFIRLVSGHLVGNEIAVPVSVSHHVNALAGTHGATVRWTKTATSALMDAARQPEVGFAASADGGFILPGFLPAFDAAAALVKLMELLALEKTSLADVVSDLPRPHVIHETVVTPWDRKGLVMRSLVEQTKDLRVELIDGVKVWHDQDWILALPDVTEPVTHLWAEGATEADARRLAEEYARRIRQLVR
jgi:mannose-1-phosphate guanylyltransferase/phosphomannomutase